ncbi:uncharacterized protein LOC105158384 [Sesamum indicum]|uniref:Uncharacterized protein LOC105158384 n=1 Tax=Sesamum indicum TaxID=4182 RepID=A0A6I9SVH1_SESIN|nr:uncharacterized protein LOC105158384 [Sesamum indicum]
MASCPFPFAPSINHHHHAPPPILSCPTPTTNSFTFCFSSSPKLNLHRSFPSESNSWSGRCRATSPESEPPSKKLLPKSSGAIATFSRLQDTLRIFFAVLFWMSLFFWSSAWNGGDSGRPNKGSRSRK